MASPDPGIPAGSVCRPGSAAAPHAHGSHGQKEHADPGTFLRTGNSAGPNDVPDVNGVVVVRSRGLNGLPRARPNGKTGKRPPGRGRQSRWRNENLPKLEDILNDRNEDLTLVVGNGVNLANQDSGNETWKALLEQIGRERGFLDPGQELHETHSLVELSDLLQLHFDDDDADGVDGADDDGRKESVQSEFCNRLKNWKHGQSHENITNWARKHGVPVLTTNFDETLFRRMRRRAGSREKRGARRAVLSLLSMELSLRSPGPANCRASEQLRDLARQRDVEIRRQRTAWPFTLHGLGSTSPDMDASRR